MSDLVDHESYRRPKHKLDICVFSFGSLSQRRMKKFIVDVSPTRVNNIIIQDYFRKRKPSKNVNTF